MQCRFSAVNVDSGLCVGTATGTSPIMQESCFTQPLNGRIEWTLIPVDPSNPASDFHIEYVGDLNYPGGFCIAADTFNDANGNALILAPCAFYDTSQYFNLG